MALNHDVEHWVENIKHKNKTKCVLYWWLFSFIYIYVNMIICVYVFNYVITLASLVCVAEKKDSQTSIQTGSNLLIPEQLSMLGVHTHPSWATMSSSEGQQLVEEVWILFPEW